MNVLNKWDILKHYLVFKLPLKNCTASVTFFMPLFFLSWINNKFDDLQNFVCCRCEAGQFWTVWYSQPGPRAWNPTDRTESRGNCHLQRSGTWSFPTYWSFQVIFLSDMTSVMPLQIVVGHSLLNLVHVWWFCK